MNKHRETIVAFHCAGLSNAAIVKKLKEVGVSYKTVYNTVK